MHQNVNWRHEAIALHTSVCVADAREPEIALTHFGAGLDVLGLRRADVADRTFRAIVEGWPRERFKAAFNEVLRDQADRKPGCHIAKQLRLGPAAKIEDAPFAE